jgi:signal transduction histidine kinase
MNSAGTGLGLSICKTLIEQMGGEVQVASKLGEGTTFTIIITTKSRV